MACKLVVQPIIKVIELFYEIITVVQEYVCTVTKELVSVTETVQSKHCKGKWWNPFCWIVFAIVWVTKLIDKVVCDWILTTIKELVKIVKTYVTYVLKLICSFWGVIWSPFLCLFGNSKPRCIRVCAVIATKENGSPILTQQQVNNLFSAASGIYAQCNLKFLLCRTTLVPHSSPLTEVNVEKLKDLFLNPTLLSYYQDQACSCCDLLTIYFTDNMTSSGWAAPGENWVIVKVSPNSYTNQPGDQALLYDAHTITHETGHLALLPHTNDPTNFMHPSSPGQNISSDQCCRIRHSRFAKLLCKCP